MDDGVRKPPVQGASPAINARQYTSRMVERTIPLSALRANERNPRQHPAEQIAQLTDSHLSFGQFEPVIVLQQPDGYIQIKGHGYVEGVRRAGDTAVKAWVLPEDTPRAVSDAVMLASNLHAQNSYDDPGLLAPLIEELQELGVRLSALGTDEARLDELLAEAESQEGETGEEGAGGDAFDARPQAGETRSRSGDIWQLGEMHRLLVGDSRNEEDVSRLLDGLPINVVVTSPPYASQRHYDQTSGFLPITPEDYEAWFAPVAASLARHLASGGSYFLNIKEHTEEKQRSLYVKDLTLAHVRKWGWKLIDEFCWTHQGFPGAWPNRFKNGWEPVYHYARSVDIHFYPLAVSHLGDTAMRYNPALPSARRAENHLHIQDENELETGWVRPSNVLALSTGGGKATSDHPADFPIALPEFFIKAYSEKDGIVFDPFGGSGSTLIASERTGRQCRMIEISPRFADVILARYEAETGDTVRLLSRQDADALAKEAAR